MTPITTSLTVTACDAPVGSRGVLDLTEHFPRQILIGAIIEKSPADLDGRLRPGDELLFVDGIPVVGKPHRYVIDLMHGAARNGQVNLVIRRRLQAAGEEGRRSATCNSSGRRG